MHSATEPQRRVLSAKIPSRSCSASIASSLRPAESRQRWKQLSDLHAKGVSNLDEVERRHIPLSAFNPAVIGAVNVSQTGEFLLR